MSTEGQPSLWKYYVLKAVIAALILYAGYEVFVNKHSQEQLAPTQDELDSLSGDIELIEEEPPAEEPAAPAPEAKPEAAPGPPAGEAPPAAATEPPPNLVELVQPFVETGEELPPEAIDGYQGVTFDKLASDPVKVAKVIYKIIRSRHPALRYPVGLESHAGIMGTRLLPGRLFQWMLGRATLK